MRPLPTVRSGLRAAVCAALLVLVAAACQPDVNMINADPLGTGSYPDEAPLAPSNLTPTGFGQLFASTLDGQVYAQPLVNDGTLLAVTEHNSAYGLDPVTGATKWHTNYGTPWNPADLSCGDLVPEVGITGTPVIDPATHHAYFTSKSYVSGTSGPAVWYLHDVDVATGAETAGWPVRIQGHADNDSTTVFDATHEMQRAGLSLVNGIVYLSFGAHCDRNPYVGWVVGVSASAPTITTLWSTEIHQSSGGQAGIWQSGGGLVTDAAGSLYAVTGNGVTPSPGPGLGRPQPNGLGESVVKLTPSSGHLAVADWFTPSNAAQLNSYDGDLGSGGPVGLPDSFGTAAHPHLLAVAGKEGYLEVLDRDDLGGMAQGPGGTDRVVARGRSVRRRLGEARSVGRRRGLPVPAHGVARAVERRQQRHPQRLPARRRRVRQRVVQPGGDVVRRLRVLVELTGRHLRPDHLGVGRGLDHPHRRQLRRGCRAPRLQRHPQQRHADGAVERTHRHRLQVRAPGRGRRPRLRRHA